MIDRRAMMLTPASGATLPATVGAAAASDERVLAAYTQQLLDAITRGDGAVWDRLLHDDAVVTDEGGAVMFKRALVATFKPHGPRISATIRALDLQVRVTGPVAIVTYVSDEHERFFDQPIACRYRSTDT